LNKNQLDASSWFLFNFMKDDARNHEREAIYTVYISFPCIINNVYLYDKQKMHIHKYLQSHVVILHQHVSVHSYDRH
jgi:hypothetical protein